MCIVLTKPIVSNQGIKCPDGIGTSSGGKILRFWGCNAKVDRLCFRQREAFTRKLSVPAPYLEGIGMQ